jgi:hypothetical protein
LSKKYSIGIAQNLFQLKVLLASDVVNWFTGVLYFVLYFDP